MYRRKDKEKITYILILLASPRTCGGFVGLCSRACMCLRVYTRRKLQRFHIFCKVSTGLEIFVFPSA
jgi:hypothetical protein